MPIKSCRTKPLARATVKAPKTLKRNKRPKPRSPISLKNMFLERQKSFLEVFLPSAKARRRADTSKIAMATPNEIASVKGPINSAKSVTR